MKAFDWNDNERVSEIVRLIEGATLENTGGGIICIVIERGDYQFYFGTANETWGADVYQKQEHDFEFMDGWNINTVCPCDEEHGDVVAKAIVMAVDKFLSAAP